MEGVGDSMQQGGGCTYCYWHKLSAWNCFKAVSSSKPTLAATFALARQGSMSGGFHQSYDGPKEEKEKHLL